MTETKGPVILTEKIEHLRLESAERLSARVCRKELWVEAEGGRLVSDPAAWASFCLVPAMEQGADIFIKPSRPPDSHWMNNTARLAQKFQQWWGGRIPRVSANLPAPLRQRLRLLRRKPRRALFFSGGVDSFHALHFLINKGTPPHALIFVEGFDFDHRDTGRIEAYLPAVRKICEHHGVQLLRVRTNLRRLPFFRDSSWSRTHGLAMAGVGHCLRDYGHIYIASSFQERDVQVYGSRWDVDPLFTSALHRFYHVGDDVSRHQKIALLASDPLARQHLRVCWQDVPGRLNCGACEKCLRTMLSLKLQGVLDQFPGFPDAELLDERLSALTPSIEAAVELWLAIRGQELTPDQEQIMRDLFMRSFEKEGPMLWEFTGSAAKIAAMAAFCGHRELLMFYDPPSAPMQSRTNPGPA